jgi:hypothetical protein
MACRPNRETVLEREKTAWRLRCEGQTTAAIGKALGITRQGAEAALRRVETRERRRLIVDFRRSVMEKLSPEHVKLLSALGDPDATDQPRGHCRSASGGSGDPE